MRISSLLGSVMRATIVAAMIAPAAMAEELCPEIPMSGEPNSSLEFRDELAAAVQGMTDCKLTPEQEQMIQEWMLMLAQPPVVPPPPVQRPVEKPSGTDI